MISITTGKWRQNSRNSRLKKQRGMTLVELIVVLSIIGTMSIGIVKLIGRALLEKGANDVMTDLPVIDLGMKQYLIGRGGAYSQLLPVVSPDNSDNLKFVDIIGSNKSKLNDNLMARLYNNGVISKENLFNPLTGKLYLLTGSSRGPGYFIDLNKLSDLMCVKLLSKIADNDDWLYVAVYSSTTDNVSLDNISINTSTANSEGVMTSRSSSTAPSHYYVLRSQRGDLIIDPQHRMENISTACSGSATGYSIHLGNL